MWKTGKILGKVQAHQAGHLDEFCVNHSKLKHGHYKMIYQWWDVHTDSHQIYHPYLENKMEVF